MKALFSVSLLVFLGLNLVSCASYMTRKSCEATNWFEYGKKVALEGRRLSGDDFIQQCYKAEGEVAESDLDKGFKTGMNIYCQPDTAYQTGRNGNFFSQEMCTGQGLNLLLVRHKEGVLAYCQKGNGYSAGAVGRAYNKICPINLEAAFLPEFNRGRKRFLQTEVSENEKLISSLESDVSRLTTNLRLRQLDFRRFQSTTNPADKERNAQLNSEINRMQTEISGKQNQAAKLREKNRQIRLEIVQLEG